MFYYFAINNGEVDLVMRVEKSSVEDFYREREKAEAENPAVSYILVPKEMEPLAEYAVEMSKRAVDCEEIGAQIQNIREALCQIEWEIEEE